MEKPDFSDLYKFYVSLGILLVALSGLAIWLIFTTNDALVIKINDINQLTDAAKKLILEKQVNLSFVYKNSIKIAGIIFLPGLGLIWFGLRKWHKRQIVIDKMQDRELEKLEKEFKTVPLIENEKRIENEIIENEGMEPDEIIKDKTKAVQDYKNIENSIINEIVKRYKNNYEIRHNFQIENSIFDLIMIPKEFEKRIIVAEIKYYTKEIQYSYLMNGIRSFLLSLETLKKYIYNYKMINYDYKYIIIWVYKTEEQYKKLEKYKYIATTRDINNIKQIDIQIVKESDIKNLKLFL